MVSHRRLARRLQARCGQTLLLTRLIPNRACRYYRPYNSHQGSSGAEPIEACGSYGQRNRMGDGRISLGEAKSVVQPIGAVRILRQDQPCGLLCFVLREHAAVSQFFEGLEALIVGVAKRRNIQPGTAGDN